MSRLPIALLALCLTMPLLGVAGTASAQGAPPGQDPNPGQEFSKIFGQNVTHDKENKTIIVEKDFTTTGFKVPANYTVILRGVVGTFNGGYLNVSSTGRLVLESTSERATKLQGTPGKNWAITVVGTLDLQGTPERPVVFEGLSGSAGLSGVVAAFFGGVTVAGNITGEHVRFVNYTTGLFLTNGGTLVLNDTSFESAKGLGLMASNASRIDLVGSRFEGLGAMLFLDVPQRPNLLRNVTFNGSATAIMSHGAAVFVAEDVRITNARDACVNLVAYNVVKFTDLTCEDFATTGILLSGDQPREARPHVAFERLRASSVHENTTAILGHHPESFAVRNSTFGPLLGNAVTDMSNDPVFENVTFQGVDRYDVVLIDSPTGLRPANLSLRGEPGGLGWGLASMSSRFLVLNESSGGVVGAKVDIFYGNGTFAYSGITNFGGIMGPLIFDTNVFLRNGTELNSTYRVQATSGDVTSGLSDFVPNGTVRQIRLGSVAPMAETNSTVATPQAGLFHALPALPAWAVALVLVAVAARRRSR